MSSSPTFDWDPAGPDRVLAVARGDVAALRVGAAREALAGTRTQPNFDARAFRSLVLAAAAASSNVVETWAKEEPENPDALLLYARVAAHRALTARRDGDRGTLEAIATKACAAAHRAWPADPTPFVVELTLLRLRLVRGGAPARPPGAAEDPAWALWREAEARHAGNREAGQRLLALCYPRHGGTGELASDTAAYLASVGPPYGVNQLLPLVADLEQEHGSGPVEPDPQRVAKIHQLLGHLTAQGPVEPQAEQRRRTLLEMLDLELRGEQAIDPVAEELSRVWFDSGTYDGPPASATVSDFSVLAEALHRGGRFGPAWRVLQHIQPYASPFPWSRHGPPEKALKRVYRDCRRG
ncbi:hypothetical protein [Actinospica sp.]|uniref:hypothetical protein n=1 Tax=Actinospica sp. TaxID=1872142 RepID=UPI002C3DFA0A|nr:hypothetical protein [Actinospica sp.]HWG25393.1 hypothetical protein [Actinospica sp.]